MSIDQLKTDSPPDVTARTRRISQAVVGHIHRSRGAYATEVVDMAISAWENVATNDYIHELATRTMPGSDPAELAGRLLRDTMIHLNDFQLVARGDAKLIQNARALLSTAVGDVTRHS